MAIFQLNTSKQVCDCEAGYFNLSSPDISLFDSKARALAEEMREGKVFVENRKERRWEIKTSRDSNKPTQLRKFYDELCMWTDKTQDVKSLEMNLPFIKMMNAKVAYAKGRDLVDEQFLAWFSTCMDQIKTTDQAGLETLRNFRTLFEAFIGFYKMYRPK